MSRVKIPVTELEFEPGGNTIWIHGPNGATVARIKTMGKFKIDACQPEAPTSHFDVIVKESINICLDIEAWKQAQEE